MTTDFLSYFKVLYVNKNLKPQTPSNSKVYSYFTDKSFSFLLLLLHLEWSSSSSPYAMDYDHREYGR
jgi:hypothetical protein